MHVVQASGAYDASLADPEALLARCETLKAWSEALLEAGAERVTVVQRFGSDHDFERSGVRYLFRADGPLSRPLGWLRTARLRRAVAAAAGDVVHWNGLVLPLALSLLRRSLPPRVPLLVQDHGGRAAPPGGARRWPWRLGLGAADAFLFTAAEQARPWREAGLLREDQPVHAVPEASRSLAPLARDRARAASELPGSPALLWVGRLVPGKDPLGVLSGFERALPELPRAEVTFVHQTDELLSELRRRIAAAPELAARVHLRGRVEGDALPALYSAADAFVLGSRHEGSGFALIEAMACGALPVVTAIPPFRALAGPLGRFWEPGDPASLARALASLAGLDLAPLRTAVRARFETALSWPAVARAALAAYRDAIARREGRA